MTTSLEIARVLYHMLRKHQFLTDFEKVAFDDLPHDMHEQLVEIARCLPTPDPMEGVRRMRTWCIGPPGQPNGNYQAVATIERFLEMERA